MHLQCLYKPLFTVIDYVSSHNVNVFFWYATSGSILHTKTCVM